MTEEQKRRVAELRARQPKNLAMVGEELCNLADECRAREARRAKAQR